jgi:hypothetical protein
MKNNEHAAHGIVDAVETLSSIAEMDVDREIGVTMDRSLLLQDLNINYRTIHWLHQKDTDEAVEIVRETFLSVLDYLKDFYKDEYETADEGEETIEGIKTIMVLVGEAAKKLDRFNQVFKKSNLKSVTKLKEYKQLESFYKTKLAKRIEKDTTSFWAKKLSQSMMKASTSLTLKGKVTEADQGKKLTNIFVDLDSVKRDVEYELFLLSKDDGSHFYNPRLIRNIKLVCDFGDHFGLPKGKDPLIRVGMWLDKSFNLASQEILNRVEYCLDNFFYEMRMSKDRRTATLLSKAILALFLCANPRNLMHNTPVKSCTQYFSDFQGFFRAALQTRSYRRWIAYPPKGANKLGSIVLELAQALAKAMYSNNRSFYEVGSVIQDLIDLELKEKPSKGTVADSLLFDYEAIAAVLRRHPYGPLNKVLEYLEAGKQRVFDPLMQDNIPQHLYDIYIRNHRVSVLHLPSPTQQEFVNKAFVIDEFRAFLRSYLRTQRKKCHVMFNFQDRSSWKEHPRSRILEEFEQHKDFKDCLMVVTIPKDDDFYHQIEPYHNLNHADSFMAQFLEQMTGEGTGFYFPEAIKSELFSGWAKEVMEEIHQVFFAGRNVLTRKNRTNFIEIFYLFLQMKIIDCVNADSISFTSKDGIDSGTSSAAQLFVFSKIINGENLSKKDLEHLESFLFLPSIMIRERNILNNCFHRMLSCLRLLEDLQTEQGVKEFSKILFKKFKPFYHRNMMHCHCLFQESLHKIR